MFDENHSLKIRWTREAFGLSQSAMADLLQATHVDSCGRHERQPNCKEMLRRIDDLYEVAQQLNDMNPYHYAPGKLMKQKLADGPSMLERLSQASLDPQVIQKGLDGMLSLMKEQRNRMDRAKARSAKFPPNRGIHREEMERLTGSVASGR